MCTSPALPRRMRSLFKATYGRIEYAVSVPVWPVGQWRTYLKPTNSAYQTWADNLPSQRIGVCDNLRKLEGLFNKNARVSNDFSPSGAPRRGDSNVKTNSQKRLHVSVDGQPEKFDVIFLRDACSCPLCVDPSSRQKLFQTSDIPSDITATATVVDADGLMRIKWNQDIPGYPEHHVTELTPDFFRTYSNLRSRVRSRYNDQRQVLWDRQIMKTEVQWLDYDEYISRDEVLFEALRDLSLYGMVFLRGVPDSEQSVEKIGARIGTLKDTFYGRTWDVRSVPRAKNIAYTNQHLDLHMDLLYFASPPGLQLLHCLRNSVQGGESIFADAFRAATMVRLNSSMLFESLLQFPVTYHYRNDSQHYHFTRPTVELEKHSYHTSRPRIAAVNWSPPFQAPFEVNVGADDNGSELRRYRSAAAAFSQQIQSPHAQHVLKLQPGDCVIFNNRRLVHARRAFDLTTGERWLKGAYLDEDVFRSRWRVLSEAFRGSTGDDAGGGGPGRAGGGDEHI